MKKLVFIVGSLLLSCSCQSKNDTSSDAMPYQSHYSKPEDDRSADTFDEFLDDIVEQQHRYYTPKYPLSIVTYENDIVAYKEFDANYSYFSESSPLIGAVTKSKDDIDATNLLLLQADQKITDPTLKVLSSYEILAKILAYRDLKEGMALFLPSNASPTASAETYVVERLFYVDGDLPAFGLVPRNKTAPPILLFRGTDSKNFASVLADLDLDGPGYSAFLSSRDTLKQWCVDIISQGFLKPQAVGYSLGGVLVEYMCIFEKDVISSCPKFPNIAFNPPGVNLVCLEKWYAVPEENRSPLTCYINEGDMVSTVGKLIGEVYEFSLDELLEPIAAHVTFITAQSRFYIYQIDVTLKHEKDYSY